MGELEQITKSVEGLDGEDFKIFAKWFAELQAERWDRQIQADAEAGTSRNWNTVRRLAEMVG